MESRAHALAAGIFALALGLAAAFAVWWLSGKREATEEYLVVSTRSLTGLNSQGTVRYRGVRAGKVQDISVDPDDRRNILVRIRIGKGFPITRSTTAQINTQGVTGLAYVQLDDDGSSDEPLTAPPGQVPRIALRAAGYDSLTDVAAKVLAQVQVLVSRVNVLLSEQNLARINGTLANLETASASLSDTMKAAPELMAQLKQVASDANIRRLNAILANLERTSGETAPLARDLRQLVASLQSASKRIEAVSADAGAQVVGDTLPRMNGLLEDLSSTSRQLGRLLQELEKSPQALLFGPTAQRPGPGEAGFDGAR